LKLIIVESPAKARTIEKFLGDEYTVAASYGHIRDLPGSAGEIPAKFKDRDWARLGVNVDEDYSPIYVVGKNSKTHVTAMRKLIKGADELLLATDEDREGEAISWHVLEVLAPKIPVKRITFHEITKSAIERALASPRDVDLQVVRAQEGRRILDRLFGYSLSPVLWKKVRTKLSAGRVQSVALRLIVELEEARQRFREAEYWDLEATLSAGGTPFSARLHKVDGQRVATGKDFDPETGTLAKSDRQHLNEATAATLAAASLDAVPWCVGAVERKETRKRPSPPFITSTLQQAASSRLSLSPRRTMQVAQRLYEGLDLGGTREGLITYMRTDSLNMSGEALAAAETFIRAEFGTEYANGPRRYRTKSKSAQEAHEAIRPTNMMRTPDSLARYLDKDQLSLYRLIWQRAIASQMTDALLDNTKADLLASTGNRELVFRASGSVVKFPGFYRVSGTSAKEALIPALEQGEEIGGEGRAVSLAKVDPLRHVTSPPARFTEASLIKRLEEEGIGRPSTYAPTISTIQNREYAVKKKGALLPTYVGMAVTCLLRKHFANYVDLKFTARMEEGLDGIAAGKLDRQSFLDGFYKGEGADATGLVSTIERELPLIAYPDIPLGDDPETGAPLKVRIGRTYYYVQSGEGDDARRVTLPVDLLIDELTPQRASELLQARDKSREPIGTDPESDKPIFIMTGPYGPYLQLGKVEEDGPKPKRVSLGRGTDPNAVDMELALKLLALPRVIGEDPDSGKPVRAGLGRFGPYVERERVFASVENVDTLFTITLPEAIERIVNKNKKTVLKELGAHPESSVNLQVLKGRYGPYVTDGKVNASLPRGDDPADLTMDGALALLATAAKRKKTGKKKVAKKKTKKKTTKKKVAKKTTRKKTTKKKAT
jgi:DNA topoisomerase I